MPGFDEAVAFVLRHEGGHVDDPADPGGETKFGISKRSYPALDIAALTEAEARAIYRRDWWEPLGCADLPPLTAWALLDTAINVGPRRAGEMLQAAYNDGAAGDSVDVDGVVGPLTRLAVGCWTGGDAGRDLLLANRLLWRRLAHYTELAAREPHSRYLRGWTRRVCALADELAARARLSVT